MAPDHYVIIGNGPAANQAALTLREKAPKERVTMIGRECAGYYRPDFLPRFIAGKIAEKDLFVRPPASYKAQGIKLRLGQEVIGVDFELSTLTLDHKEVLNFDGLIIAVGGKPRIPESLQVYDDLLLTLKTVVDARAWKQRLGRASSVLLMGGDLTSLSVVDALLAADKKVSFILRGECFWPVSVSSSAYETVINELDGKGVEVLECKKVNNMIRTSDDLIKVETDAGDVEVGVVGAFFGLVPDVGFLIGSGLHIERGILVDEYLCTPFEGVYAAGDCAQVYHPDLRDYWVSIGFKNANNLGRLAALNLLGARVEAEIAPESIFHIEGMSVNTPWWTEF